MNTTKRILCIMLTALFIIGMIPTTAFAGENEYCPECHESYTHAYCVECRKCNFCVELCEVCEELCEECCVCIKVTVKGTISGHDVNKDALVMLAPAAGTAAQSVTVKAGDDSYSFTEIPAGKYTLMVIQSDIIIAERTITVSSKNVTLNFSCSRPPCPSCGKEPVGVVCDECGDCSECAVMCPSHALCNSCSVYLGVHCAACTKCGNEYEICPECGICEECIKLCEDCGFCAECALLKGKHCPECNKCYTHAYCVECRKCNFCVELCEVCEELCEECCVCIKVTVKGTISGHDVNKDALVMLAPTAGTDAQSVTVKAGDDSYSFTEIPSGEYMITVIQSDIKIAERTFTAGSKNVTVDLVCTLPDVCPSCMEVPEGTLCADCGYCAECALLKGKHCPECNKCYTHAYCVDCGKCNFCVELCEVCEELCYECCVCNAGVKVTGSVTGQDKSLETKIILIPDDAEKTSEMYIIAAGGNEFSFRGIPAGGYVLEVHQGGEKVGETHIVVEIEDVTVNITVVSEEKEPVLLGDVNGDGYVNALDATQILRYSNGKTSVLDGMSEADAKGAADVNGDGYINALDATQILRYANGKVSVFDK